jgi:2-polyprenyl-6-methoxyphenol hydroxylase-like FAD-dependent oxidoreductase
VALCTALLTKCLQEEYQKARLRRNSAMIAALHSLQSGFQAAWPPGAVEARGLGMSFLNAVPGVRNHLMQVAMGDL